MKKENKTEGMENIIRFRHPPNVPHIPKWMCQQQGDVSVLPLQQLNSFPHPRLSQPLHPLVSPQCFPVPPEIRFAQRQGLPDMCQASLALQKPFPCGSNHTKSTSEDMFPLLPDFSTLTEPGIREVLREIRVTTCKSNPFQP